MFNDLLVIDASSVLAGPSVGSFFAELGARVIKIEHPAHGDVTRTWKLPQEDISSNVSAYFSSINYLKEYNTIDYSNPDEKNQFLDLISRADILISNFKLGDAKKFGIEDDYLLSLNPKLIIAKINGYGEDSDRVAYDLILQAESGFMSMNGTPDSGPVKMPVALIDVLAGHHLKEAILVKLLERSKTGRGTTVSVSLYDAAISSLVNQASNYLMTGSVPKRIGSLHPNIAPYGEIFETVDGALITFAIGTNKHFEILCNYLDLNALLERFPTNQERVINRKEIAEFITERISRIDSSEILEFMQTKHVPAGKIKSLDEVFEDTNAKKLIREEVIDQINTKRVTSKIFK